MRKTMNLKGFFLILGMLLIVFTILFLILRTEREEKLQEQNLLESRLLQLVEDNKDLTTQLNVVGTSDYIVSSAMENFSYINKGDIRFEYSNPDALDGYTEAELRIYMDGIMYPE